MTKKFFVSSSFVSSVCVFFLHFFFLVLWFEYCDDDDVAEHPSRGHTTVLFFEGFLPTKREKDYTRVESSKTRLSKRARTPLASSSRFCFLDRTHARDVVLASRCFHAPPSRVGATDGWEFVRRCFRRTRVDVYIRDDGDEQQIYYRRCHFHHG